MNTRRELMFGMGTLGTVALGLHAWQNILAQPQPTDADTTREQRIPNTPLYTHEGKAVRFYDDLVRGKVVTINMMYVSCAGICPTATANLRKVQKLLGDRAGRDVFMYSISLQPLLDTPEVLKAYAELHGIGPGWQFLTGDPADIEQLRYALGFYDPDPLVDANDSEHTGMVRIGSDADQRWTMSAVLATPRQIWRVINHVDRTRVSAA